MSTFKVSWEIEIEAENPLAAAKKAQEWQRDLLANYQYYVQKENFSRDEDQKEPIYSVDLSEEDQDAVIRVTDYEPLIEQKDGNI